MSEYTLHYHIQKIDYRESRWDLTINSDLDLIDELIYEHSNITPVTKRTRQFDLAAGASDTFVHSLNDLYCSVAVDRLINPPNNWYKDDIFLTVKKTDANTITVTNELPDAASYYVTVIKVG